MNEKKSRWGKNEGTEDENQGGDEDKMKVRGTVKP